MHARVLTHGRTCESYRRRRVPQACGKGWGLSSPAHALTGVRPFEPAGSPPHTLPPSLVFLPTWSARRSFGPAKPGPPAPPLPVAELRPGSPGWRGVTRRGRALRRLLRALPGGPAQGPPQPHLAFPGGAGGAWDRRPLLPEGLSVPEWAQPELGAEGQGQEACRGGDPTLPASWAGPR